MKMVHHVALIGTLILPACGEAPSGGSPSAPTSVSPNEVTSLSVGAHTIHFFAKDGLTAVAETGPEREAPLLSREAVGGKKPSVIYRMVAGAAAAVPQVLLDAENLKPAAIASVSPPEIKGDRGTGPTFYNDADQAWFASVYCTAQSAYVCVQGWNWANGASVSGVGYLAAGFNGSEATASRNFNGDYWNGSAWQNIVSFAVPPGNLYTLFMGDTAQYPSVFDPVYTFKGEIYDDGVDNAEVSLAYYWQTPAPHVSQSFDSGVLNPQGIDGYATLTISNYGDWTLTGHTHDGDFWNWDYSMAFVSNWQDSNGAPFGEGDSGQVYGTISWTPFNPNVQRDHDYNDSGNDPRLAQNYAQIAQQGFRETLHSSTDIGSSILDGLIDLSIVGGAIIGGTCSGSWSLQPAQDYNGGAGVDIVKRCQ